MAAHTPGPWLWQEGSTTYQDSWGNHELAILLGANGEQVCNFGDSTRYYPTEGAEPSDADKALIAAAPDLLAALIDCRRALEIANFTQELAIVDAAIAKATAQ